MRQRSIDEFMMPRPTATSTVVASGWNCITDLGHGPSGASDVALSWREAGGGGDCMFHSIAACLADGRNFMDIRRAAAGAINAGNAADILMDMAAQRPKTVGDRMDPCPASEFAHQAFKPDQAWNANLGNPAGMAEILRAHVLQPGCAIWGDATLAAVLEGALGVNIILLAVDSGANVPPTPKERMMARTIYSKWIEMLLKQNPGLLEADNGEIVRMLADVGCTIKASQKVARSVLNGHSGGFLKGRRQTIGTVSSLCTEGPRQQGENRSLMGYSATRPTIVIWNRGNVHWVPIAVGPKGQTVIRANDCLRGYVDSLLQ
jgi:hypothetical protein